MAIRPIVVEQFRGLPGTVEIIGLGGLRQPRGQAQEAEIEVLVACDEEPPGRAGEPVTRVLWLGCGQLDFLVPGSLWRGGRPAGFSPSVSMTGDFEFVADEPIGAGAEPQPGRQRPFPSRSIAAAPGFLLRRLPEDGVVAEAKKPARPSMARYVLLPQMELLRGLFGVSSGFLLELFDGIRNPAVSGERGLVDRNQSRLLADGTVRLVAGRNLAKGEALVMAAVVADPSLRQLHDSAFQQLSVNRDWREGRPTQIDLAWPWREPVRVGLEGRWIERAGVPRRFIAMRLSAIAFPMPFERIEIHHPGGDGSAEALPPPDARTRLANAGLAVVTTGLAASTSRRPVEIPTAVVDLAGASAIEISSIAHGGGVRNDRAVIGESPRDEANVGTGGRQPDADAAIGPASTHRRRVGPEEAVERTQREALEATWTALEAACAKRSWTLDALPRSGQASRAAVHGGLDLAKEPLVACVTAPGSRLLVVDRGSPSGDERSLGILVPLDQAMSGRALAVAARRLCDSVDGRWRSRGIALDPQRDVRIHAVNRDAKVWKEPDAYARMLGRRIAAALGL